MAENLPTQCRLGRVALGRALRDLLRLDFADGIES
jgi:hypothetical protein